MTIAFYCVFHYGDIQESAGKLRLFFGAYCLPTKEHGVNNVTVKVG